MRGRTLAVRWLATVLVGSLAGVVAHRVVNSRRRVPAQEVVEGKAVAARSHALLGCYAMRLHELAVGIESFSNTEFANSAEVRASAKTWLLPRTRNMNAAFKEVNVARIALGHQLLRSFPDEAAGSGMVCRLRRTSVYQWREMRPLLNTVEVNVIRVWDEDASSQTLEHIRRQQKTDWLRLRDTLEQGAREFGGGDTTGACESAAALAASKD